MKLRVLFGFLVLVLGIIIGYAASRGPVFNFFKKETPPPATSQDQEPERFANPLLAVVVENLPGARPQAGLAQADLVFETLTESGITRFLAFFESREATKIGPVRSLRPYFLDWAYGFGAIIAYSGGSVEALEQIKNFPNLKDANEFYNEKYFWRDNFKTPPHNLFTSTKLLWELAAKKAWGVTEMTLGWTNKADGDAALITKASEVEINFSSESYVVSYQYEPPTNSYKRFLGGGEHLDGVSLEQISAKNVVVLYTASSVIDKELLTIDLQTSGSGRAVVFRDGGMVQARWQKLGPEAPLRILDADGSLIALNFGPTWFEVIDQTGSVSWE